MFAVIATAFLLVFLLPEAAHAWGPATHLELAREVMENPSLISGPARALIEAFPYDFLYGSIAADIVVGKNLVEELKHCHNWKIGFRILKKAASPSQRAFAYGYLSHLAADTVAHNHFIPEMMIRTFNTRMQRHVYWELRFDAMADKRVWQLPKKIVKSIHDDNDRLLDSTIEDTPLSFRTNKTIFSSIMSLHRFDQWHGMLNILSAASRWRLDREDKRRYAKRSLDAVTGLLSHGARAACVKKDPTGKAGIASAQHTRARLKRLRGNGDAWEDALEDALAEVRG
ncbi:MAG: zinc dependent phospholipase C family protein [Deltaproteobacteria bacterium]|nr:zinc dependent phospholipase C family protein [Deltaproteobacteria bacterium]